MANLPSWAKILIGLAAGILAGMILDNILMFIGVTIIALMILFRTSATSSDDSDTNDEE